MLGKFALPFLSTPVSTHTTAALGAGVAFSNNTAPANEIANDLAWLAAGN